MVGQINAFLNIVAYEIGDFRVFSNLSQTENLKNRMVPDMMCDETLV